jgi:hypothetical protein
MVAVSNLSKIKKTKEARKIVNTIIAKENLKNTVRVSMVFAGGDSQKRLAFRNLENVRILNLGSLNTLDILQNGLLIFERDAIDTYTKTKVSVAGKIEKENDEKESKVVKRVVDKKVRQVKSKKGTK